MSHLDEYIQLAEEKGLNVEWKLRLIYATASLFNISPERIADDALKAEEYAKKQGEIKLHGKREQF